MCFNFDLGKGRNIETGDSNLRLLFSTQRRSRASQILAKKIVNFSRENQISSIIRTTKGKRTILLKFHQFYSLKNPQVVRISFENHFPLLETTENPSSQPKTFRKIKTENLWRSPVTGIVPKTLRSPLCSQNVSFLEKLRRWLRWKQIRK